jgi:hypothetical protein
VLRALAHRVAGTAVETAHAQAAADGEQDDAEATLEYPSVPLPGYYVAEIVVTGDSPAAGRKLGDVSWRPASVPVLVLRGDAKDLDSERKRPGCPGYMPRAPANARSGCCSRRGVPLPRPGKKNRYTTYLWTERFAAPMSYCPAERVGSVGSAAASASSRRQAKRLSR